jgi:hypothetical protein
MGEEICMKFDAENFYKELSGSLGWTVLTTTSQEKINPFLHVSQVKHAIDLLE